MNPMTLIELAANKVIDDMTEQTIRSALILCNRAKIGWREEAKTLQKAEGHSLNHLFAYDQGVHELCAVLQKLYGFRQDIILSTIKAIAVDQRHNQSIGFDQQDYIELFELTAKQVIAERAKADKEAQADAIL